MKMSRAELAEAIGFSASSITDIETGHNRATKAPIDPAVIKRYRLACAAVALGVDFDWLSMSIIPDVPVEIRFFGRK